MTTVQTTNRCQTSHHVQSRVSAFVRTARDNAYSVGMAEELEAQRLLAALDVTDRQQVYWAFRSLLCSDREQWESFDALFESFWLEQRLSSKVSSAPNSPVSGVQGEKQEGSKSGEVVPEAESDGQGWGESDGDAASQAGASDYERLAGLDFQFIANSEQQRQVERLVERLAKRMKRKARRRQVSKPSGQRISLRQTMRRSLQTGGVPMHLKFQVKRRQQSRMVLIVDVSRSMSIYSTVFLRFARALVSVFGDADAFAFHTRLVHITEALKKPDLLEVKHHLALISQGFSGGTRVGHCLETFEREYGRSVNRRSTVIIVSDGLDTGEPEQLVQALGKIKERCRRVIWLNPLLGREGYETRTQSMMAVLPLIDLFAPVHNLRSLEDLEPQLICL